MGIQGLKIWMLIAVLLTVFNVAAEEVTRVKQGDVEYVLDNNGVLSVTSPVFKKPLLIENYSKYRIKELVPVSGLMFVTDSGGSLFLLVLPGAEGFFARQMSRFLNTTVGEKVMFGRWTDSYRWDLIDIHQHMMIDGHERIIASHDVLKKENGMEIILHSLEINISMQKLIAQMDTVSPKAFCSMFLKAHIP